MNYGVAEYSSSDGPLQVWILQPDENLGKALSLDQTPQVVSCHADGAHVSETTGDPGTTKISDDATASSETEEPASVDGDEQSLPVHDRDSETRQWVPPSPGDSKAESEEVRTPSEISGN